jgi:DNA polymerase phi
VFDAPGSGYSEDIVYSRDRLIRGLASSRAGAREGFATALTALLKSVTIITPHDVHSRIVSLLPIPQQGHKSEIRDAQLGRLCAYASVLGCGRLDSAKKQEDAELVGTVTRELLTLMSKASAGVEAAILHVLKTSLPQLPFNVVSSVLLPYLEGISQVNTTVLGIDVIIRDTYGKASKDALKKRWAHGKPLHIDNAVTLINVLTHATPASQEERHEALHPVWSVILHSLIAPGATMTLADFWLNVVDSGKSVPQFDRDHDSHETYCQLLNDVHRLTRIGAFLAFFRNPV